MAVTRLLQPALYLTSESFSVDTYTAVVPSASEATEVIFSFNGVRATSKPTSSIKFPILFWYNPCDRLKMGAGEAKDVNWQLARTPGPMKCVSVGGDNVWAIDLQNQIWRLCVEDLLDFNWKKMDGTATYISGTEGGSAWCINSQEEIHEWYKGWTSNRWEKRPGTTSPTTHN
jgi:hypothetical protein